MYRMCECVKDCVSGVLHIDQGKAAVRESCMQCGHCVAVCPVKAVSIPEYDMADVAEYDKDSFTYTPECFLNAVKFRRSIRSYKDRRVEREQLLGLIEAGRYTATAVNTQSVELCDCTGETWRNLKHTHGRAGCLTRIRFPQNRQT